MNNVGHQCICINQNIRKMGGMKMKKWLGMSAVAVLMVFSLFTGSGFANESKGKNNGDYIEGQLVISIEDQAQMSIQSTNNIINKDQVLENKGFEIVDSLLGQSDPNEIQAFNHDFTATVVNEMGMVYLVEYDVKKYKSIDKAKKELEKTMKDLGLEVRYVSENFVMHAMEEVTAEEVSIAMHNNQRWHYEMINAPQAWNITTGSRNVRIAVLDTGIDANHPNLRNLVNTSLGRSFVGGGTGDVQGHGTHVAGTIASYGSVSGVMQNATLIPVKVLGDNGSGSMYGIQQGILYAASVNSDVINMSLGGGGYSQGMDDAIRTAVSSGTIVVAATGNDSRGSISYPAAYSGAIAVGSVTSNRTRSSFSNYGQGLELMAPGSNIYSTYPNGQFRTLSGTSMATPHVAGVAGLMRAANPNISVAEARSILQNTAQYAGSFNQYGHGIVDANAAVRAASGQSQQPSYETNTTVSTNASSYTRGQSVTVRANVVDQDGQALSNATVQFTITRPNGTTVTNTATTNNSGVATWTIATSSSTARGTYGVQAATSLSGYEGSTATTRFSVN